MKGSATIVLHTREILGRYTGISTGLYTLYIILQYVWVFSLKVYGLVRKITDVLKLRNQQKIQVYYLIFFKGDLKIVCIIWYCTYFTYCNRQFQRSKLNLEYIYKWIFWNDSRCAANVTKNPAKKRLKGNVQRDFVYCLNFRHDSKPSAKKIFSLIKGGSFMNFRTCFFII